MGEGFRLLPGRAGEPRTRWVPFWALQVLEVAVALVFVDVSVHVRGSGLLLAATVLFFLLALTADGPLGIFRICNRHLHLVLTVTIAATLALAPIVPAFRPDIEGIIVLEFGMVGIIRVATLTRITDSPRVISSGPDREPAVVDATATVVDTSWPSRPGSAATSGNSDSAGPQGSAARRAGRATGAAVASGKKVAAHYRPEAEAHLRRTIRGAGRLAGRLSRPSGGNDAG